MIIIGGSKRVHEAIERLVAEATSRVVKDLDGLKTIDQLQSKVAALREQSSKLTIEKSQKEEEFARREREIEHKVGLERARQEQELKAAKREAIIEVREQNLSTERKQFEAQMKFQTDRFAEEQKYLKDLMGQLLQRLPDITANLRLGGKNDGNK